VSKILFLKRIFITQFNVLNVYICIRPSESSY
jgi:hypothetical protein